MFQPFLVVLSENQRRREPLTGGFILPESPGIMIDRMPPGTFV